MPVLHKHVTQANIGGTADATPSSETLHNCAYPFRQNRIFDRATVQTALRLPALLLLSALAMLHTAKFSSPN